MKYIVLRTTHKLPSGDMVREYPIVFPDALIHADVAAALALHLPQLKGAMPCAAGSLSSMEVGAVGACHGKSETLGNLKSRGKQDDTLMMCWDYLHGVVDD